MRSLSVRIAGSLLASLWVMAIQAQPVRIENGQFVKGDGTPFYCMAQIYVVQIMYLPGNGGASNPNNLYISPNWDYGAYNYGCWECSPTGANGAPTCLQQIRTDFNVIKAMGFNAVHVAGLNPTTLDLDDIDHDYQLVGDEYRLNIQLLGASGGWNNTSYTLDATTLVDTDPYLLKLFGFIDQVAAIAADVGLELMIDGQGNHDFTGENSVEEYETYLELLAAHVVANDTPLMAYIVEGEPGNGNLRLPGTGDNTKYQVCEATNRWYHALKDIDPDHLVGNGFLGLENIRAWDPAIMKMDFFFPHIYVNTHDYDNYEDIGISGPHHNLEAILDRFNAQAYWLSRNCPVPWMLGETGFNAYAEDAYALPTSCTSPNIDAGYNHDVIVNPSIHTCPPHDWVPSSYDGDEEDQREYYERTLAMVRNCNAAGYSLWHFQDHFNSDCTQGFGLLKNGVVTPSNYHDFARPAADEFEEYLTDGEAPPVEELAGPPENYYDMCHARAASDQAFGAGTIPALTGTVTDEDGEPIKDAIVFVMTNQKVGFDDADEDGVYDMGEKIFPIDTRGYTFTNEDGYFSITPFVLLPGVNKQYIRMLSISAAGYGVQEVNSWGWPGMSPVNGTDPPYVSGPLHIILKRADPRMVEQMEFFWLDDPSESVEGTALSELQFTGILQDGSSGDFRARNVVHTSEFRVVNGSFAHLYTAPVDVECSAIPTGQQLKLARTTDPAPGPRTRLSQASIDLVFERNQELAEVQVFPNPATGELHIVYPSSEAGKKQIVLFDPLGHPVRQWSGSARSTTLDLRGLAPGPYLVWVSDGAQERHVRIIVNTTNGQ